MGIPDRVKQAALNVVLFSGLLQGQDAPKPAARGNPAAAELTPLSTNEMDEKMVAAFEKVVNTDIKPDTASHFKISPPNKHKEVHAMLKHLHERAKDVIQKLPAVDNPFLAHVKMKLPRKPPKLVVFDSKRIHLVSLPEIGDADGYVAVSSEFLKMPKAKQYAMLAHEYAHGIFNPRNSNMLLWSHYNGAFVNNYMQYLHNHNVPQDKQMHQYVEIAADGMAVLLTCDAKSLADGLTDMANNSHKLWSERRMKELKASKEYKHSSPDKKREMKQKIRADNVFVRTAGDVYSEGTHPGNFIRKEMLRPIGELDACPIPPEMPKGRGR